MKKIYPPLIITTAALPGDVPFLEMRDSEQRIAKYLKAINIWLKKIPDLRIVLCDGTGFDWIDIVEEKYPNHHFECLHFINDMNSVKKYGKGFGEIEILNFAVNNSRYVAEQSRFMKITGKYWVNNICKFDDEDLFCDFKCKSTFLIFKLKLLYINSSFFICSSQMYLKYFYNSSILINYHSGDDLEHVMGKIIISNNIKNYQFKRFPGIAGWSGTSNTPFDLSPITLKDKLREIKYRLLSWVL